MRGKKLKIALAAIFTVAAAITYAEGNGFGLFDRADGTSALCDASSDCRYLTEGEIEAAREIYGDNIDYSKVKIFNRYNGVTRALRSVFDVHQATSPNGNIYLMDQTAQVNDLSKDPETTALLIHELAHVWQRSTGRNLVFEAIGGYFNSNGHYRSLYDYEKDIKKPYASLNLEAQAEMIEAYWRLRSDFRQTAPVSNWTDNNCEKVRELEAKISEELEMPSFVPCRAYQLNNS